jgi:hypothetical protein
VLEVFLDLHPVHVADAHRSSRVEVSVSSTFRQRAAAAVASLHVTIDK